MVRFHDSRFVPAESAVTLLFVFLPWCPNILFFPLLRNSSDSSSCKTEVFKDPEIEASHGSVLLSAFHMLFCLCSRGLCCNSLFRKHPLSIRPYLHSLVFQVWNKLAMYLPLSMVCICTVILVS